MDGKAQLLGIAIDANCPVVNTPLDQLSELFPDLNATVVGVWRHEKLFVPHSTDQLETGDLAYVVCQRDAVRRELERTFREFQTDKGLRIPAEINFFTATRG